MDLPQLLFPVTGMHFYVSGALNLTDHQLSAGQGSRQLRPEVSGPVSGPLTVQVAPAPGECSALCGPSVVSVAC